MNIEQEKSLYSDNDVIFQNNNKVKFNYISYLEFFLKLGQSNAGIRVFKVMYHLKIDSI